MTSCLVFVWERRLFSRLSSLWHKLCWWNKKNGFKFRESPERWRVHGRKNPCFYFGNHSHLSYSSSQKYIMWETIAVVSLIYINRFFFFLLNQTADSCTNWRKCHGGSPRWPLPALALIHYYNKAWILKGQMFISIWWQNADSASCDAVGRSQ